MELPNNLTQSETARLKANEDDNCLWHREIERIYAERRIRTTGPLAWRVRQPVASTQPGSTPEARSPERQGSHQIGKGN